MQDRLLTWGLCPDEADADGGAPLLVKAPTLPWDAPPPQPQTVTVPTRTLVFTSSVPQAVEAVDFLKHLGGCRQRGAC